MVVSLNPSLRVDHSAVSLSVLDPLVVIGSPPGPSANIGSFSPWLRQTSSVSPSRPGRVDRSVRPDILAPLIVLVVNISYVASR